MFEGWGNFYFLLGSAAAALIGLMFVVTTLTRNTDRAMAELGQRLFMTPTVFNFAAVLTLSSIALAPKLSPGLHEIAMAAFGAYGLGYASVIVWQGSKFKGRQSHWSDFWCYGVAPFGAYLAFETSVMAASLNRDLSCDMVALSLLALLLIAIRNAWDLVTWMAPRSNGPIV